MNYKSLWQWFSRLLVGMMVITFQVSRAQISIRASDLPSQFGTYFITEDDTLNDLPVDVGFAGANQTWRIEQSYPRVLTGHYFLDPVNAPYHTYFPNSNLVLYFCGRLGNWLHSYYFDDLRGNIYMFQNLNDNSYQFLGMGIDSSKIIQDDFNMDFKGAVNLQPDLVMHPLPLSYGQNWKSVSEFGITKDTTILGVSMQVRIDVKDSLANWVDGWGTLILPKMQATTLRIKTYSTVFEKIYINNALYRDRKLRSIHYTWIAKNFGTVARVISHSNESDPNLNDNFTRAKQISRLHLFKPQITFTLPQANGSPGALYDLPIVVSDVTDLSLQSIQFHLTADPQILQPIEIQKTGTLIENWDTTVLSPTDSGVTVKLAGVEPLSGHGTLGYIRCRINPNAVPNASTTLYLRNLQLKMTGPVIVATPGKFEIKQTGVPRLTVSPSELNFSTDKSQLTFQILNGGEGTLVWQAVENPEAAWITQLAPVAGNGAGSVNVQVSREGLKSGVYNGQIQITSNGGNQAIAVSMEVSETQVTFQFPNQGWYLVSLPVIPADNHLTALFPTALAAFGYNPITGSYELANVLVPHQGYWLLIPANATVNLGGAPITRFTEHYLAGWHLIGSVMGNLNFADPGDTPNGAIIAAYGWNPVTAQYFSIYPTGTKSLNQGQGYWLAVIQACDLTLGGSSLTKENASPPQMTEYFLEKYGALPPPPPTELSAARPTEVPNGPGLLSNYPNPFNPETLIYYTIQKACGTQLFIINAMGQRVRTLVNAPQTVGTHQISWDGRDENGESVTSGIYFSCLVTPDGFQSKKMLLLR